MMNDPIADMLTRIRNAQAVRKELVQMQDSKFKSRILSVLKQEGYIKDFKSVEQSGKKVLEVYLKYYQGKSVIDLISRYSKPGVRRYVDCKSIPSVRGGLGVAIISTSKGVMSGRQAKKLGLGGEVICLVQ